MLPYLWPGVLTAWMQMYLLYITWMHLSVSLSVVFSSATPWTVATRLLRPCDFPGKNTGRGCHSLLQRIFLTQGLNPGLLHRSQILYCLSHRELHGYICILYIYM